MMTVIGDRSWLDGFDPRDIHDRVIAVCVLDDNTVALLKFRSDEPALDQD